MEIIVGIFGFLPHFPVFRPYRFFFDLSSFPVKSHHWGKGKFGQADIRVLKGRSIVCYRFTRGRDDLTHFCISYVAAGGGTQFCLTVGIDGKRHTGIMNCLSQIKQSVWLGIIQGKSHQDTT